MPESGQKQPSDPLHAFNFLVSFQSSPQRARDPQPPPKDPPPTPEKPPPPAPGPVKIAEGAFSEVTGLEATVEPFAINEGGRNWGQVQRVGRTTFSTVVLRRGMTRSRHLWQWFQGVHDQGRSAYRLDVTIQLRGTDGNGVIEWKLKRALPVKMKLADLNAAGQEVAIEELHLVHEGIIERLIAPPSTTNPTSSGGGTP